MDLHVWLNDDDANRLYAIYEQEKDKLPFPMSVNDFASELLERRIRQLHPDRVVSEDE